MINTPSHLRMLAAAAAALFAVSCAQSVGDVNQVQPNVMKKADLLDGQWYFRNTVTYTPFNTQFTYPGQTGNMEKVVWEIQQGQLVGYRSYPYIPGSESTVDDTSKVSGTTAKYCDAAGKCVGGQKYYGAPVVSFPISSHFDIQRGYNPATGEQTNVISENASDRPWNQREFMRVDWSMNQLNKASGLSWGTVQNPVGGSSTQNWIQPNEKSEDIYDWPSFEYDSNGKLKYFDITGRYMANPDTYYFDGFGNVPLCLISNTPTDCSSSEIKMRVSISKVDAQYTRDYEPLVYGNDLMSMFGYFRTERLNWDRRYGALESARILIANRYRTWESYYKKDANGEPDYSQPIPLAERKAKPIVYYFTRADRMGGKDRYDEFWEVAPKVEQDYDRAFRRAIGAAQGKDLSDTKMFYLCNNPVTDKDPAICGAKGFSPKFGDLRYSFVNTVAEPVANGLLGFGPSSADPETGMIMSGNSNTYTWGVDSIARDVVQKMQLINGDLSIPNYVSGKTVKDYISSHPVYNLKGTGQQALQAELQSTPQTSNETRGAWDRPSQRMASLMESMRAQNMFKKNGSGQSTRNEMKVAAEQLAQHPELESAVLDNPDVQADLVNLLPPFAQARAEQDPDFRRQVARTVLTDFTASQEYQKFRTEQLSKNCVYMAEFYDRTLLGIVNEKNNQLNSELQAAGVPAECFEPGKCMDKKQPIYDKIARSFRQETWLATTLHEAGHTFNLRHNFQGSFDAVNYPDQYWNLRKQTITVKQGNEDKLPRTPADMKAAAEGNDAQKIGRMYDYEYSSIMDYSGKRTGDWVGIGKYDEAAIIFAYSGTTEPGYVEVFKTARGESKAFKGTDGNMMTISGAAVDLPMVNATATTPQIYNYTERFHYSTVPLHFGEGSDINSVINNGVEKLKASNRELKPWKEVKAQEAQVRQALINDPTLINDPARAAAVTQGKAMRVPYMFCSDESADGPVLSCFRFDRGPDYYEKTRQQLEDYWSYYFDSHFRRDRLRFSGNSAFLGTFNTYYRIANMYKHWVFRQYRATDRSQEISNNYKVDPLIQDYWTMAVLDGVNNHLNVMAVPEFGLFYLRNLTTGPQWDLASQGDDFDDLNPDGRTRLQDYYTQYYGARDFLVVPRGAGRRMYSRYDFKSGYGFFQRMTESGHYNDQIGAMYAAVLPNIDIQGVDDTADRNRFNIPYYLVFRPEFQTTFASLWALDENKVRPQVYRALNNAGQLTENAVLAQRRFVNGADLFTNFDYPKPPPTQCASMTATNCVKANQSLAPINISITYSSRIYSLYLGMAMFRVNYDLDYAKSNQVFKLGSGEAFNVAPGYHTLELPDVVAGARYIAVERDNAPPDSTPAVRMLTIGNAYLTMVNNPATCPLPAYLEQNGFRCMNAADVNNPALLEVRRKFWVELYQDSVTSLDQMRGFYSVFGSAF